MFLKNVVYVEVLSLALCQKTGKWVESLGRKNDENLEQLLQERREILDCGVRLLQCIDKNSSSTEQILAEFKGITFKDHREKSEEIEESSPPSSSGREEARILSPQAFPSVFSDSGIDVTQEDNENTLLIMNGLTAVHNNGEPLESINALRDILNELKKATDKAVVRFLVRSRDALQEEIKSQSDIERDEKLLGLISDLLRNKHEAEKQLKDMSNSHDEGNPLSVLEKSLCYVLVDKALLNCLLILDKALMDGKLTDSELSSQFSTAPSGQKLVSEFSQALNEKRQFIELSDELRRREILVDKMRTQIRELSSEKLRLENENKSFEEKSRLWQLKSEDEEMRNSVIDSERKRLKEKVLFLEESMSGLQSSTEHLRQQLQTLEQNDDASRQENKLLKEKLQNCSDEMKRGIDVGNVNSETSSVHLDANSKNMAANSKNMAAKVDSLLKENQELRNRIKTLEKEGYDSQENSTHSHQRAIEEKNEEIRVLKEENKTLGEDVDTRSTEILLFKAQVVELERRIALSESKNDTNQTGPTLDNTDGVLVDRKLYRAETSEHRAEECTTFLEELAKRKGILVNKLEMAGAVTVIKNDYDVPDGYTEAIDGVLRSQTSLIEKGVLSMLSEREERANERRLLEEENRRLRFTAEASETENLLLQVQVSDLIQTVEELEDDLFYMKCGGKPGKGKRPGTPGGSSGHRVTFDVESDKKEDEKLESLIQNAKERCKNLEKQVRSNTSLLKTTQHQNKNLLKNHEDLQRENCNLRQYLEECQRTKKILHLKIAELEESLQSVDDRKSLDEMEKQSLIDRLKIFEGQIKSLKLEKEMMRSRMESSLADTRPSPYSKFILLEEASDDALKKNGLVDEVERLKNKIKKQSARSRILKSEVFEFLDDIRCLENELGLIVDSFGPTEQASGKSNEKDMTPMDVNTWGVEASLCQQNGMAPIMFEIVELLKSAANRLQRISRNSSLASVTSADSIDGMRRDSNEAPSHLKKQLCTEVAELRNEKQILHKEVFALKAISENINELQPHSPEDVFKANEKDRTRYLRNQVLDSVQRNSELEGEILDYLTKKWALESELDHLKELLLNLKNERDTLLSLGDVARPSGAGHNWGKSSDKNMRHFCFVKNCENEFEVRDVLRIESDLDNEDVFSCPSDEGVCHSPDREASSCDSGYNSCRHEDGHKVAFIDKGDSGPHCRFLTTHTSTRPLNVSCYDNSGAAERPLERHVSDPLEKKPKGILKKRNSEHGGLCALAAESG